MIKFIFFIFNRHNTNVESGYETYNLINWLSNLWHFPESMAISSLLALPAQMSTCRYNKIKTNEYSSYDLSDLPTIPFQILTYLKSVILWLCIFEGLVLWFGLHLHTSFFSTDYDAISTSMSSAMLGMVRQKRWHCLDEHQLHYDTSTLYQ